MFIIFNTTYTECNSETGHGKIGSVEVHKGAMVKLASMLDIPIPLSFTAKLWGTVFWKVLPLNLIP